MANLSVDEKLKLIKRNLFEVLGEDELDKKIKFGKKFVVYWGTAPTGKPHVGYFFPMLKLADLLRAGCYVKILIADIHGALDNSPWEVLDFRYKYYTKAIKLMIESFGVESSNLEFVKGSDFQLEKKYVLDLLKLTSFTSLRDARKAAAEVVKNSQGDSAKISGFVYPLMQSLDEVYLKADAQLGGTDQRKIMVLARENLVRLGYEKRIELMNPLVPGLIGEKMSASDEKSKIDLLDDEKSVLKKLKGAEMVTGNSNNGVMAFLKYVLMVLKKDAAEKFIIERPEKYGGNLEYSDYEILEKDYVGNKIHPLDLKLAVAKEVSLMLKHLQKKRKELEVLAEKGWEI